MQEYDKKTIADVVVDINRKYFLPDIQRNFVWKPEQIYALFDSIMRDYPISTFLFWVLKGDVLEREKIKKREFIQNNESNNPENTEINSEREYSLVLDGQQRLTAFFIVLKGNYIIRDKPYDLYFNILSGEEEREDGVMYEFKFFNKDKGTSFLEDDKGNKQLWYRVKNIFDIKIAEIFTKVPEISKKAKEDHGIDFKDNSQNNIAKLCSYLKSEKLINFYPEKERSYDTVLDIFVRTNSGGTPLSYSDLLFSTIKSEWEEARKEFDSLLVDINNGEMYRFSYDFILKTALVLYANSEDEVRYKTKNFKSDLIDNIKNNWSSGDKIKQAITLAVELLKDKLLLTSHKAISSYNSIIPIVYWIYKNKYDGFGAEKKCINDTEISKIRVWLIKSLLSGIFGGQSDSILFKCKKAIENSNSSYFPAKEIEEKIDKETKRSIKLEKDFLDKISYNSSKSSLVLSICYKGSINFQPRFKGNMPEQDHIFSQNELDTAKIPEDKVNCIYNIRYIGGSENKKKSKTPFDEWMNEIGKDKRELEKHLIPEGEWSIKSFDKFLEERKKLIELNFNYD